MNENDEVYILPAVAGGSDLSEKELDRLGMSSPQVYGSRSEVPEYDDTYNTLVSSFVDEKISSGISVILDIDVQGFKQVKQTSQDNVSIFILPPSLEELEQRLFNRGSESSESIKKRLKNAPIELRSAEIFDYVVVNDEFDNTIKILSSILFDENIEYNDENAKNILKELLDY